MHHEKGQNVSTKRYFQLTKLWLCVLCFNLFLQLDCVEKWFDPANRDSIKSTAQLDCSSLLELKSPYKSKDQILTPFVGGPALTPSSKKTIWTPAFFVIGAIDPQQNLKLNAFEARPFISKSFWSQTAGRAPPLA